MSSIGKKNKYELENQVISKMFRENKRYRTRVIPNKKREYKDNGSYMDQNTKTRVSEG
tara:strand:+ start:331 stop:504 length:174 start_codon:yes stop_codon:yes gene_type:complete